MKEMYYDAIMRRMLSPDNVDRLHLLNIRSEYENSLDTKIRNGTITLKSDCIQYDKTKSDDPMVMMRMRYLHNRIVDQYENIWHMLNQRGWK